MTPARHQPSSAAALWGTTDVQPAPLRDAPAMTDSTDRGGSLMDRSGMGLLPGLVLAMGVLVFAMAALLTGSMWAVAGVLVMVILVTGAVVYVVLAVLSEGDEGVRMRRHVPGLSDRL